MNVQELKTLIDKDEDAFEEFIRNQENHVEIDGVAIAHVEYERHNSGVYNVFKVGNDYFKVEGHYDSWSGTDWEYSEIEAVKPVEKTITVYEAI